VAAFFFRNEPPPAEELPELLSASELDREIDQPRIAGPKPYTDLDRFEEKFKPGVKLEGIELIPESASVAKVPPSAEPLFDNEFDFLNDPVTTPPNPIPRETAVKPEAGRPISERKPVAPPAELAPEIEMFAEDLPVATPEPPAPRTYEVRPGDTLSEIASRLLGSQARYQQIFEANRDQLKSPNDLKPGMKLRIPDGASATSASPDVTSARVPKRIPLNAELEAVPIPTTPTPRTSPVQLDKDLTEVPVEKPTLKFEPVQRNPLIPRRTKPVDPSKSPGAGRPSANLPADPSTERPVSSQAIPQTVPKESRPTESKSPLPSLDGLEPLQIPAVTR
jgi:hypothetical protein